jgi:MFS family permease
MFTCMPIKAEPFSQNDLKWGRLVTGLIFFVLGTAIGSWLGRLAEIQKHLGLDAGVLGGILLAGAVAGLVAMQIVPALLRRFGHRAVLAVMAPVYPLTILGLPFAKDWLTLTIALIIFSAAGSMLGVIVNTHAVDVEEAYERAIMSSFHAMFSVGGLTGSAIAAILAGAQVSVKINLIAIGLGLSILTAACISRLLKIAHADPKVVKDSLDHLAHHSHKRSWWKGVLLIGGLSFVAYMAEGSIGDWSAIFMREQRHAPAGLAVAGFVTFSAFMALGRLAGDRLTERFGKIPVIRGGAFLAGTGLLSAILIPNATTSIIGFGLVGCGLAVLVPVLFSLAGGLQGGETHAAIARISTIAFFGLLVGPALIGLIANHFSLHYALLVPTILLFGVGLAAPLIRRVHRTS